MAALSSVDETACGDFDSCAGCSAVAARPHAKYRTHAATARAVTGSLLDDDFALVELQGELQVRRFVVWKRNRVVARITRGAVAASLAADGRQQAVEAQI